MKTQQDVCAEIISLAGFSPQDQEILKKIRPHLQEDFDDIVSAFYSTVTSYPEAPSIFTDERRMSGLRASFAKWLDSSFAGPWDHGYYISRLRIGRVHVDVGLPQHYMNAAMHTVRQSCMSSIEKRCPAQLKDQACHAVHKLLDVELSIMLQSYQDESRSRIDKYQQREQQQLTTQLTEAQNLVNDLLDASGLFVLTVSPEGVVFEASDSVRKLFPTIEGSRFTSMFVSTSTEKTDRFLAPRPEFGQSSLLTKSADNAALLVRWQRSEMPGDNVHLIGTDVSAEEKERRRAHLNSHFGKIGTMAAGLAHEIRNPLNSAKLQITLLKRRLGQLQQSEASVATVELIEQELVRLTGLVTDFLEVARPRQPQLTEGNLTRTLREVILLITPEFGEHGVSLVADLAETVTARYDADQIKQCVMNLLRNAREAAGDGGVVEIKVKQDDEHIAIEVSDSGPGFPEGFDPWAPFATTKAQGTGLGMAVVQRMASDHGGEAIIERRDKRTIVAIVLPQHRLSAD